MDLLLKIPRNKPPFIGIIDDSFKLFHFNNDLPMLHRDSLFRINLMVYKEVINLKLICDEKIIVREYSGIKYDPDKLKTWKYLTKDATSFNFSHVYKEYDKEIVCRLFPGNVVWVLKVEQISFESKIKSDYE